MGLCAWYQSLALFCYHTLLSQQEKHSFWALRGPLWHGFRSCEKAYRRERECQPTFWKNKTTSSAGLRAGGRARTRQPRILRREIELPLELLMWIDLIPGFVMAVQRYRLLENAWRLPSTGSLCVLVSAACNCM